MYNDRRALPGSLDFAREKDNESRYSLLSVYIILTPFGILSESGRKSSSE